MVCVKVKEIFSGVHSVLKGQRKIWVNKDKTYKSVPVFHRNRTEIIPIGL